MLLHIMVIGAIVSIGYGLVSELETEMNKIKSMEKELEEVKSVNAKIESAFSKLVSAIKVSRLSNQYDGPHITEKK